MANGWFIGKIETPEMPDAIVTAWGNAL